MKVGDIVTTKEHAHKMTVYQIDGEKVTADYFIGSELFRKEYSADDLTAEGD